MKYLIVLAAAGAALAGCSSGDDAVRQAAMDSCESQIVTMEDQLASVGATTDGLCECALEDFDPSASQEEISRSVSAKTQECIMEQMTS